MTSARVLSSFVATPACRWSSARSRSFEKSSTFALAAATLASARWRATYSVATAAMTSFSVPSRSVMLTATPVTAAS